MSIYLVFPLPRVKKHKTKQKTQSAYEGRKEQNMFA